MKALDDYFSPAQTTLFHYTGIGALLRIVESKKLFASHAYYLNDSQEITHASALLGDILTRYEGCVDSQETEFLGEFARWLQSIRQEQYGIFIFSLSEQQSLLSQWRSYTPHGKGVSIGFSTAFVNDLLAETGFRLAKCIYDYNEQRELVSALAEKMFESFRQRKNTLNLTNRPKSKQYFSFLDEFRGDLLQVFSIIKHHSFQEECEWRIISRYFPSFQDATLHFREGASMLMPYIEIPFPHSQTNKKVFDKVVLGPSQNQNLSMAALSSYLSNQNVCDLTLNCGIPYRKWQ